MKVARNILDLIGHTPLLELNHVASGINARFIVKMEMFNPGGSIKDRIGSYMCRKAMERGELKPGQVVIEATSGNTGIGIAQFCCVHGLVPIFVMSDKQSQEKINMLRAYGAQVVVCPTNVEHDDPRSYYQVAQTLADAIPGSFYANQYDNDDNWKSHYELTGPEIFEQTQGQFDYFVAGVGTGGTISGTATFLKEKMQKLKVVGVDIKGSILAHYHETGEITASAPYVVEGIGDGFLPKNIHFKMIDEFITVDDRESFAMTRTLLEREGIYCGGSCGAAVAGAVKHALKHQATTSSPSKQTPVYLIILPDSGSRYLSKVYNNQWMEQHQFSIPPQQEMKLQVQQKIKSLIPKEVHCFS